MSAALYIVLEEREPGFDVFVNGKALSAELDALDALATAAGVAPLLEFFSQSMNDLEGILEDEGLTLEDLEVPEEKWYDTADGLATVRGMLRQLDMNPDAVSDATSVAQDLAAFERVLVQAAAKGIRWHLAADF